MFYGYTLPSGVSYKQMGDFNEPGLGAMGDRTLRRGMQGGDVTELQQKIIAYYAQKGVDAMPRFGADGDFGGETEEWVKKFQSDKGLTVDGIAGQQVFSALAGAVKTSVSSSSSSSKPVSSSSNSVASAIKKGPSKKVLYGSAVGVLALVAGLIYMQQRKA